MALHRLTQVVVGVPDVPEAVRYYRDFGLTEARPGVLASGHGGEQLALRPAPRRALLSLGVGVHDVDDLARIAKSLARLGCASQRGEGILTVTEPATGVRVRVEVAPSIQQPAPPREPTNSLGRVERASARSRSVERTGPVRPSKLGHVVLASTDYAFSRRFFLDGIGFRLSDEVRDKAAFLRCTSDHHNLLVRPGPFPFLHHTAWEVEDVDEVGRGAFRMLEGHPERHVWGLGRHHIGSNFFWYLKDPAGNFTEYYSDMDCALDDEWTPEVFEGMHASYNWGPPPPPSFVHPEDLAALMTGSHAPSS